MKGAELAELYSGLDFCPDVEFHQFVEDYRDGRIDLAAICNALSANGVPEKELERLTLESNLARTGRPGSENYPTKNRFKRLLHFLSGWSVPDTDEDGYYSQLSSGSGPMTVFDAAYDFYTALQETYPEEMKRAFDQPRPSTHAPGREF